ncbi:MAG: LLM class flavin-dependent oxidoreductase [Phyllobacteriaceae bacterium]|nr:LLM class flavin-dependent oxidoreductase [Phyllobacteriaceae bacterium]
MEIGLYTFGDLAPGRRGPEAARRRLDEVVAAAKLADEAGLAVFGVGEHHRADYAISAPAVVLGAIAAVTRSIRLSSAVTILSSDDPVRVFEAFSTVDLLSGGRAEIMAGRGAFVESFPLFGLALEDYEELFEEKLELLLKIVAEERVSWRGRHRPALADREIAPRPIGDLPVWIAAGGTPASAVRAGRLGLPLNLADIGVEPLRFKPFIDLYRQTSEAAGHGPGRVALSAHCAVGRDGAAIRAAFLPHYADYFRHNLPQRDAGPTIGEAEFARLSRPEGALFVGSPAEIVDKILYGHALFGHERFTAQIDIGGQPFAMVAETIERLAVDVLPEVRKALA